MADLLFVINGLGLGNSTRCAAIIDELLRRKLSVEVATSGNGIPFFRGYPGVSALHEMSPLNYGTRSGKVSLWRTFRQLPKLGRNFRDNSQLLRELIAQHHYRAVVIDSDYSVVLHRDEIRRPIIAINNSEELWRTPREVMRLPLSAYAQLGIELADLLFHRAVPDLVISPTWGKGSGKGRYFRLPSPVRRIRLARRKRNYPHRVLVMASGSGLGLGKAPFAVPTRFRELRFDIVGIQGASTPRVKYYGQVFDTRPFLARADILVTNAGFSSLSEAIYHQLPSVVIPLERHAEQLANAMRFEHLGLGLQSTEATWDFALEQVITHWHEYRRNLRQLPFLPNGAHSAAERIHQFLQD